MYAMQDQSVEAFLHILDSTVLCDMPKLLACCQHHISADPQQRFQPISLRLKRLLPVSSALRIAEGLRVAFQRMAADHAAADQSQRCECKCCRRNRQSFRSGKTISRGPHICACSRQGISGATLSKYVPGPKEFLEIAQR